MFDPDLYTCYRRECESYAIDSRSTRLLGEYYRLSFGVEIVWVAENPTGLLGKQIRNEILPDSIRNFSRENELDLVVVNGDDPSLVLGNIGIRSASLDPPDIQKICETVITNRQEGIY